MTKFLIQILVQPLAVIPVPSRASPASRVFQRSLACPCLGLVWKCSSFGMAVDAQFTAPNTQVPSDDRPLIIVFDLLDAYAVEHTR